MKSNATHVTRLVLGLAMGLMLTATAATAQQPSAKPSPSPEKKSADAKTQSSTYKAGDTAGDYKITSSIELGYRGLRVNGDHNKYQSDLNYRTEIKVAGGPQKVELKKYCPRLRRHTLHKVKRK